MRSALFSFLFLFLFIVKGQSQQQWTSDLFNESKTLYEVESSFEEFWSEKEIKKGKGWKPFKRRHSFMAPRVYPSGIFPFEKLYQEWEALKFTPKNSSQNTIEANWQAFGPTEVPLQNNGQNRGVGRVNVITFDPYNSDIIWVGAPSGGLWKSIDGGLNWSSNTDLLPNLGVSDIVIDHTNTDIMYIITGDRDAEDTYAYGLMKSTDGGLTWNTTGLSFSLSNSYRGNRILIHPNNSNILLVSTRKSGYGETYRSTDGGDNWTMVLEGPNLVSMEFHPTNPDVVYGVTTGTSKYYRSIDNGLNWTNATNQSGLPSSGKNRGVIAVTPANPNVVYILYSANDDGFGGLYKSTDGGYSFSLQTDSPNILGYQADGTDVGGQGWYDIALAVSPIDENEVYVGGINIWKSTNGGLDFGANSITHWYGAQGIEYVHADQHFLVFNPLNNVLYSGNDGGIYKSEDNGNSWTDLSSGLQITQFYKIGISQTDFGLVLGGSQDNGTLRANFQNNWSAVRGGDGMECAVDPTDPSIMYSELYYGDIGISFDGGNNWNNIAPDTDGEWITPYQIDQTNPNRLVIGYEVVYESLDYGNSWEAISEGFNNSAKIDVVCLAPSSSDIIYIAESEKVFKTIDGGENWTNISSGLPNKIVTYIAVHPTDPNILWATFSGYSSQQKVFFSQDGGSSWTNISSNLPNLPVNCILYFSPNETLFVGTDVGVFYKDSTTTEWTSFNQGLPNVIVTELEYHVNTNSLFAGTYGRGLWVTSLPALVPPTSSFSYSIVNECAGLVNFTSSSSNAVSVEWNFGDNTFSNESNTSHQFSSSGTYNVRLIASNELGSDTIQESISLNLISAPTTNNGSSCTPTSFTLSANTDNEQATINWFDAPANGNLIHVGNNYTTDLLNTSTTFYVASVEETDSSTLGEINHIGNSEYSGSPTSVGSLEFDANQAFLLESVDVFTNQAGQRKIILVDNSGNVVHEHLENIPVSDNTPYTIPLNFFIEAGQTYRLTTDNEVSIGTFGGENPQFKRSSSNNLSFPYLFGDVVSINGSYWYGNGGEFLTDYYYYFYNWKVKTICSSALEPIIASVGSDEALTIDYDSDCAYDSIVLNANGNFDTFLWENQINGPSLTVDSPGLYQVTAYDSSGCATTSSVNIPSIASFKITSSEILCEGSSVYLQSTNGLTSYLWSTGETSSTILINEPGIYSVSATDNNGCNLFDEISVESTIADQIDIQYELDSLVVCQYSQSEFSVSWQSNNTNVVWNNSVVGASYTQTFNLLGDAEVVVSAEDNNGCVVNDTLLLKVVDCSVSIYDYVNNLFIYPNPNDGSFVLLHQSKNNEINTIKILDLQGRIIYSRDVNYTNNQLMEQFTFNHLNDGMYFIELISNFGKTTKKVVIE